MVNERRGDRGRAGSAAAVNPAWDAAREMDCVRAAMRHGRTLSPARQGQRVNRSVSVSNTMFPVSNRIEARAFAMARAIRILQNRPQPVMLRHFDSIGASRSGIGQTRWGAVVHVQRGPADAVRVIQIF